MTVAALYDVHGNLPALEAVLADVEADVILVGGDIAVGPWPAETLDRLQSLGDRVRFIRGNADREVATRTHATPRDDEEILTRISPDERWQEALEGVREDVVVCGHTHVQFDRQIGDTRLVNAGSVGMPYEDEPGAYWALLGPDLELRRTTYEPGDIAAGGWPEKMPQLGAGEATEFFEKFSRERA